MKRAVLASAAATFAAVTLFASTAQACISCNYTPEVVHEANKRASYGYSQRSSQMTASASRRATRHAARPAAVPSRNARVEVAANKQRPQPPKANRPATATRTAEAKPVAATVTKPSSSKLTQTTGASLALLKTVSATDGTDATDTADTPAAAVEAPAATKTEAVTTLAAAAVEAPEAVVEAPAVPKPVGCKKFFPSAGITLSVACE